MTAGGYARGRIMTWSSPPAPPGERPSPAGYTRPRSTHGHTLQPLTPPVPAPAGRRRIFVHYGGIRRYHDFTALTRPYAEEPRTLEMHPFPGERVMASKASVDTLAIFARPKAPRKCLLGSLPKPGTLGQSGAVDKVVSENLQWEFEQKKRRPPASFHGPYQPLQVRRGR